MVKNPESFDCKIVNWDEIQKTLYNSTREVIQSDFDPTAIVGIARGGWMPARCVADFLEINNLTSVKVDHYQGTEKTENAVLQFDARSVAIDDENVLVVDDIVDTGKTLSKSLESIENKGAIKARSMTIHSIPSSDINPDYIGKSYDKFYWVIYPWNITEDINEILKNVIRSEEDKINTYELRLRLDEHHSISKSDFSDLKYSLNDILNILNDRQEIEYNKDYVKLI